jgi:tripartite-type tricarboxylate transporter receptor subunit TctC
VIHQVAPDRPLLGLCKTSFGTLGIRDGLHEAHFARHRPIGEDAINASLYQRLNYDFIRDIAPVAPIAYTPLVLVVDPSLPAKSVPEFIAYAKANPGKLNLGSAGLGTPVNVTGELFKMKTGINVGQVQYRGSAPALADLLGGQVQAMFPIIAESIEYIRAGRLCYR